MSWITVIFSMSAASCLTIGVIYSVVWYRSRTSWAHLLFSVSAYSTAVFAFFELWMLRAETPAEFLLATKWAQVPIYTWLLSMLWFVRIYLGAGRLWLAWAISGVRTIYLLVGLFLVPHILYRQLDISQMQFLGESVTVAHSVASRWYIMGNASAILLLVFMADATITAWRRGDRQRAVMIGGSAEFFLLMTFASVPVVWGLVAAPMILSLPYMAMIAVMGYELSRDVLRASELVADLRASNAQISDLFGRLIAAQESERTRIARDLHDDVSQRVAGLSIMISVLKRKLSRQPLEADVASALTSMQQTAMTLAEEIRHVSHDLHPNLLQHAGLAEALDAFCAEFGTLQAVTVSFTADGDVRDLEWDAALCLYRITQEALRNVAKHADARHVRVELSRVSRGVQLSISDDGKGFDETAIRGKGHGLGLVSIDERVRLLHGTVQIEARPHGGTQLHVHIPHPLSSALPVDAAASTVTG